MTVDHLAEPLPAISMISLLCRSLCGVSAYVTTSHTNAPKYLHMCKMSK